MHYRTVGPVGEYVARLRAGADWRSEIESLAADAVRFIGLGAIRGAKHRFSDRRVREHRSIEYDETTDLDPWL